MKKIIIANIGNRTLVCKNTNGTFSEFVADKQSFREMTELYYKGHQNNPSQVYQDLALNIINVLIDKFRTEIEKIYLFTSDQIGKNAIERYQDTLYAGELVKLLIQHTYPHIQVKCICLDGVSVVDLGELCGRFETELLRIASPNKSMDKEYIICDSGGTSQQKSALKLVTEYILPEKNVAFYSIIEKRDSKGNIELTKGSLHKQDFYQIRNISVRKEVELLIDQLEYSAAISSYKAVKGTSGWAFLILEYLNLAKELRYEKIAAFEPSMNQRYQKEVKLIKGLQQATGTKYKLLKGSKLSEESYWKLCLILELASAYFFKGDYTNAFLKYHIFIEQTVILFAKDAGYEEEHHGYGWYYSEYFDDNLASFPSEVRAILEDIRKCHDYLDNAKGKRLNNLRNDLAHQGKGISQLSDITNYLNKSKWKDFTALIKDFHQHFGVPFERKSNLLLKTNKALKDILKKI